MLGQWATELNHVTGIVGGFNSQQKHAGQDGVRFVIVPKNAGCGSAFPERECVCDAELGVKPEYLRRIEPPAHSPRESAQERILIRC
jgi:hypothetical protein